MPVLLPRQVNEVLKLAEDGEFDGLKAKIKELCYETGWEEANLVAWIKSDRDQSSILHKAVKNRRTNIFIWLCGEGEASQLGGIFTEKPGLFRSFVDAKSDEGTPLVLAVRYYCHDMIKRLLRLGANYWIVHNLSGFIPLHEAVDMVDSDAAGFILKRNNNIKHVNFPTQGGETAYTMACRKGSIEVLEVLFDNAGHHIDTSHQDRWGDTGMHHVARAHNLELIQWLSRKKVVVTKGNEAEETPAAIAFAAYHVQWAWLLRNPRLEDIYHELMTMDAEEEYDRPGQITRAYESAYAAEARRAAQAIHATQILQVAQAAQNTQTTRIA